MLLLASMCKWQSHRAPFRFGVQLSYCCFQLQAWAPENRKKARFFPQPSFPLPPFVWSCQRWLSWGRDHEIGNIKLFVRSCSSQQCLQTRKSVPFLFHSLYPFYSIPCCSYMLATADIDSSCSGKEYPELRRFSFPKNRYCISPLLQSSQRICGLGDAVWMHGSMQHAPVQAGLHLKHHDHS